MNWKAGSDVVGPMHFRCGLSLRRLIVKYHDLIPPQTKRLVSPTFTITEFDLKCLPTCKNLNYCTNLASAEIIFGQINSESYHLKQINGVHNIAS
jgi:hypothetical protein